MTLPWNSRIAPRTCDSSGRYSAPSSGAVSVSIEMSSVRIWARKQVIGSAMARSVNCSCQSVATLCLRNEADVGGDDTPPLGKADPSVAHPADTRWLSLQVFDVRRGEIPSERGDYGFG